MKAGSVACKVFIKSSSWVLQKDETVLPPPFFFFDLNGLSRMVSKDGNHERIATIFQHLNNGVIERILVLEEPSSQVVGDHGSIMDNAKVSIRISFVGRLTEVRLLTKQVVNEFGTEGLIRRLGEKSFFFKNRQKTHGLLKHGDAFLQVHTKVNIAPLKTFPDILLLLQYKHVVVEELLELLIGKVDADLFKAIIVKDLKASNIQATNVLDLFHGWVKKGLITFVHDEGKDTFIDRTANTANRGGGTITSLTLGYPFSTNL